MADLFISYSRKDKTLVQRLDEALKQRKREAWVDWEGIRPAEEFMQAIYRAIEAANTFVFVLTPDSVASAPCGLEIAHAAKNNKRMVPLVGRDVHAESVPEAMAKLNWIYCRDSDDFDKATDTLVSAFDTDLEWVHAHTRLLTLAVEWEAKAKNKSFVLHGDDLRDAEQWLAQAGTDKERQPTALQTEYIIASRKAETARQRTIRTWVTVAAVVAIVLAIVAWFQRGEAVRQQGIAKKNEAEAVRQERKAKDETSHSEYLRALSLVDGGDADQALRALARSLELAPSNPLVGTRLINLLGQRQWPHLAAKQKPDLPIGMLTTNADASRIIAATRSAGGEGEMHMESQFIHLYDAKTLGGAKSADLDCYEITDMQISGDRVLATGARAAAAVLLDAKTGAIVKAWKADQALDKFHSTFSTDGQNAVVWSVGETFNGVKLEIVSTADGKPRIPVLHIPKEIRTVMMSGAELRILFEDGSVTIQPLKVGKPSTTRPFPVVEGHPGFAAFVLGGTFVLGVGEDGVRCWPASQSGKSDADMFEVHSKGLTKFALDSFNPFNKITAASHGDDFPVTIVAQDPRSASATARSCVTQFVHDKDSEPKVKADWHSPFAPIFLLSSGIVAAQDTKAFALPFHGGSFSGPLHHEAQITAVCGIKEGLLATGSGDGMIKLWNLTSTVFPPLPQPGPVAEKGDDTLLWQNPSHDVELRREESGDYVIKRGGKVVKVQIPPELDQQSISSIEVSGDGELGIVCGFREDGRGGAGSGAWVFSVKDGKLLSGNVGQCEWAGFSPDKKQVLTVEFGRLTFWNLGRDKNGTMTFEKSSPILAQADMAGATVAQNGSRVATRSRTGEVIVWDKTEGKLLQSLRRDPLWNDPDLDSTEPVPSEGLNAHTISCKPALNADGRLLAAAYGRAFVVWDVDSGKPLSDPIFCTAEIQSLGFSADDSTKILATLRDGSLVSWDHAGLGGPLSEADVTALGQLALAVADDRWVDEAPKLAADLRPSSPVVATLLEHFASQARALSGNAASAASSASKN